MDKLGCVEKFRAFKNSWTRLNKLAKGVQINERQATTLQTTPHKYVRNYKTTEGNEEHRSKNRQMLKPTG